MANQTTCRSCGHTFELRGQGSGVKGDCPQCGAALKLASPEQPLQSKPVIDRSRPPVMRRPGAAPPPVPPVPPGWPAPPSPDPDFAPREGVPPVSLGAVFADLAGLGAAAPAPYFDVGGASAGGKASGGNFARLHKPPSVPPWAWAAVAAAGLIVGVLGLYAWYTSTRNAVKELATPIARKDDKSRTGEPAIEGKSADDPKPAAPNDHGQSPPKPPPVAKTQVAHSLDDVLKAIVKLEGPTGTGSGFLINGRGWIATNHHVKARLTTAARAVTYTGAKYELAGTIAEDPDRDLAIVKLAEKPDQLMTLDISFRDKPRLGQEVYAFGHPHGVSFSLSKGVVSRVLTTSEVIESRPTDNLRGPPDLTWIQHDAKILEGNSGGPLLDEKGRVLGINTWIYKDVQYGYASHIKYLRELADKSTDRVTPLPAVEEAPKTAPAAEEPKAAPIQVSADRMLELYLAARALRWTPTEATQYDSLAELAKIMTAAKHTKLHPSGKETIPPAELEAAVKRGDELFGRISKTEFAAEQVKAVNSFAAKQIEKLGAGAMLFATVAGGGPNFLLLKIEGTEKLLLAPVAAEMAQLPRGSRCLAMGILLGTEDIRDDQGNPMTVPVLLSYHIAPVK